MRSPIPYNVIIVRYNELGLKSPKVRRRMENRLSAAIEIVCKRENLLILKSQNRWGRLLYHFQPDQISWALTIFSGIIGIHSFSPGVEVISDYSMISTLVLQIAQNYFENGNSFAIRARRLQTFPMTSTEINENLGKLIIENFNTRGKKLRVDLKSPDKIIYLDVREVQTYIYTEIYYSKWGGNPIEPDKALVAWIEKDLEDIIAAQMFIRRGAIVLPVIFQDITTLSKEFPVVWKGFQILSSHLPLPMPVVHLNLSRLLEFWNQNRISRESTAISLDIFLIFSKFFLLNELCHIFNQTEELTYLKFPLKFHGVISSQPICQKTKLAIGQSFSMPYFVPLTGFSSEMLEQYKKLFLEPLTPKILMSSSNESFSFIENILEFPSSQSVQNESSLSKDIIFILNKLNQWISNQDLRIILQDIIEQRSVIFIAEKFYIGE